MKKYNKKIAERILAMIRADTYTIAEVCNNVGISRQTFYRWQNDNPEFAQAVEDANNELLDKMNIEAKKSLMKKITGYDVVETHVTTVPDKKGNPVIKEQKNVKKHIQPDTAAIIFTLTNCDPDNWKNRHSSEITGKNGKDLLTNKTDEELEREIAELQRKLDIENGFGSH
jgi:uncharacterized protein YbcI